MAVENGREISSITEAMILVKRAKRGEEVLSIFPCVQVDDKDKEIKCPKLDPTLDTLCKHPDGLLSTGRIVECPLQNGVLVDTRQEPMINSDATLVASLRR